MWVEINRYKIVNDDGNTETLILERNSQTGSFRLKNDFGNVSIELDAMSAIEFLRRAFDDVQDLIADDINHDWGDCDGDDDG